MVTSLVRAQQLLMERIDAVLRPLELTFARYEVLPAAVVLLGGRDADDPARLAAPGAPDVGHQRGGPAGAARLRRAARPQYHYRRVVLAAITEACRAVVEKATDGLNSEVFREARVVDCRSSTT